MAAQGSTSGICRGRHELKQAKTWKLALEELSQEMGDFFQLKLLVYILKETKVMVPMKIRNQRWKTVRLDEK